MAIFLRLDNDKPFGNQTLLSRIWSKVREDYWLPALNEIGYMRHARQFLEVLHENEIPAHWYFRLCTIPPRDFMTMLVSSGHAIGLHAENTINFESFNVELATFKTKTQIAKVHSFTKHGSGKLRLGRYHYPPYEPELYLRWASRTHAPFLFGNEEDPEKLPAIDLTSAQVHFSSAFWVERPRRSLEWLIDTALRRNIVVLTHPENYFSDSKVRKDFETVLKRAREAGVTWDICHTH